MGLIEYMSQNPVGLALPASEYNQELVVASINAFINNLEVIDNVVPNKLANRNMAPYQLIKKHVKNKTTTINTSNLHLKKQHSKNSESGQLQRPKQNQFCSNHSETQSAVTRITNSTAKTHLRNTIVPSENSIHLINHLNRTPKMDRKQELKN